MAKAHMEAPPAPRTDKPPVEGPSIAHWINQICTHPGVHEHPEARDETE